MQNVYIEITRSIIHHKKKTTTAKQNEILTVPYFHNIICFHCVPIRKCSFLILIFNSGFFCFFNFLLSTTIKNYFLHMSHILHSLLETYFPVIIEFGFFFFHSGYISNGFAVCKPFRYTLNAINHFITKNIKVSQGQCSLTSSFLILFTYSSFCPTNVLDIQYAYITSYLPNKNEMQKIIILCIKIGIWNSGNVFILLKWALVSIQFSMRSKGTKMIGNIFKRIIIEKGFQMTCC